MLESVPGTNQYWALKIKVFCSGKQPGPNFIIKDLPSVLILIIADHILTHCVVQTNATDFYVDS